MSKYDEKVLAGTVQPIDLFNENGYTSINLFREVMTLERPQIKRTHQALAWILGQNLQDEMAIIGGTAVAHHIGERRPLTPDLDFIVQDLNHIEELLKADGIRFQSLVFTNNSHKGINVPDFDTDFMKMTNGKLNALLLQTAIPGKMGGNNFKFISPQMQAVLKLLTGRNKDLDDSVKLIQCLKGKNATGCFTQLAKQMKQAGHIDKQQYDDLASFVW